MIYIAHRGNLDGPIPEKENHPDYLTAALESGFHVEVDVWLVGNDVYLGHDGPEYEATKYFQYQGLWWKYNANHTVPSWHGDILYTPPPALWIHCKNYEALADRWYFHGHKFSHDQDNFALTSSGYIWTYPRNLPLGRDSIAVMPERVPEWDLSKALGICTDFPKKYSKELEATT